MEYKLIENKPCVTATKSGLNVTLCPQNKYSVMFGGSRVINVPDYVPDKEYFTKLIVELLNTNKKILDKNKHK